MQSVNFMISVFSQLDCCQNKVLYCFKNLLSGLSKYDNRGDRQQTVVAQNMYFDYKL